jgi:DNA-binding MurR/RpiR family transcriptional regulator
MNSKSVITQLRFEPALLEKITEAANQTGLSKADIMRLSMQIGLEDLRRIDFDLPSLISSSARRHGADAEGEEGENDSTLPV